LLFHTPLLRAINLSIAVLLVALLGAAYWLAWRPLPQTAGEMAAPITAGATVVRDALGVPHISAASWEDAIFLQGYVTAQDRMWQMDLLRRRAKGQLAEAFGAGALVADRDVRTLGLGEAARRAWPHVPPDLRVLVEAYADGVNAWLSTHADALPLEFRVLRYAPAPWEPADSLAVGKLLALDLAKGWEDEALRARAYDRLPADVQAMLFPKLFAQDRILVGHDVPVAAAADGDAMTETALKARSRCLVPFLALTGSAARMRRLRSAAR